MSSNDTDKRAEFIAGLRAFADLLESDTRIPTPWNARVCAYLSEYRTGLDQDGRFELIHDFAEAYDLPVTEDYRRDRQAETRFGPIEFSVHAKADELPSERTVTRPSKANRTRQPTAA